MMFVRAYPRETQEMVFDAHERAFAFFRGTCTRGIYDNMKTAVETISSARTASIIGASCKCAVTIWLIRWPVRPRQGRVGEGTGRESGRRRPGTLFHAASSGRNLR